MSSPTKGKPGTKLKLNIGSALSTTTHESPPPSAGPTKIKIKFGGAGAGAGASAAQSPAPTPTIKIAPPKPKKARKPSAATTPKKAPVPAGPSPAAQSKKRAQPTEEDDHPQDAPADVVAQPQIKRLKLTAKAPTTPVIRTKLKGKPPTRPLGSGYDSESSDREPDPIIEEEFILRMTPGEDCEYLRQAIQEKMIGVPLSQGGADVTMKFFNKYGRRAVITIRGKHYAATMVDLPGVVEGMKSWDRRGWWKTADIARMLLVLGQVPTEEAAQMMPLPPAIDPKTHQYSHGLTPPLHHARRRRFRKRVHAKTIEAVEDEVERLLGEDAICNPGTSKYEMIQLGQLTRENSVGQQDGYDMQESAANGYDMDAEGEVDNGAYYDYDDGEAGLEADLEQAMMAANDDEIASTPAAETAETPSASAVEAAPVGAGEATSPEAPTPSGAATGEESSDEDEEEAAAAAAADEAGEQVVDEDTLERQRELQRQKEEIADLEQAIKNETAKLDKVFNVHLKRKLTVKICSLQAELDLKRGTTGEEEEE